MTEVGGIVPGRVGVVGAGLMGHAIAQIFASAGWQVAVYDPVPAARAALPSRIRAALDLLALDHAALDRVSATGDLAEMAQSADLVIEAVPEKLDLKRSIFADLVAVASESTVLASNSSAIPISDIAMGLDRQDRMLGLHFWNPPYAVRLVEVVQSAATDPAVIDWTMAVMKQVDMLPVHVRRDVPGFIGNRLQHALKREAIALVAAGVCDPATLDLVVREGFGARLAVLGPLEQSDMIGLDLTLDIHKVLMPHLDNTPGPHPHLVSCVAAGATGMAKGCGFRTWTPEEIAETRGRFQRFLRDRADAERRRRIERRRAAAD